MQCQWVVLGATVVASWLGEVCRLVGSVQLVVEALRDDEAPPPGAVIMRWRHNWSETSGNCQRAKAAGAKTRQQVLREGSRERLFVVSCVFLFRIISSEEIAVVKLRLVFFF